jgi:hypothetical protein
MRYVNNLVDEGFLKCIFVKSFLNKADHLAKNVSGEIYDAHINDYIIRRNWIADQKDNAATESAGRVFRLCRLCSA